MKEEVPNNPAPEIEEVKDEAKTEVKYEDKEVKRGENDVKFLQKRLSSQKSFEMEDILDSPSKIAASNNRAPGTKRRLKSSKERQRAKRPLPHKAKYDYPIVRHHPLFAKQRKPGETPPGKIIND